MDENRKTIVVLSGAGISAESGIKTFRDSNGLWENHNIYEVASPIGWGKNPQLVLDFYNARRAQARSVQPNAAHFALAELEKYYNVLIVTQNVDDLHERAGSAKVLHLHGELNKARSTVNEDYVIEVPGDIALGDTCPQGGQMRPHIVWFGEDVPLFPLACEIAELADIMLVVGTSLAVYPAAGLTEYAPRTAACYIVDPGTPDMRGRQGRFKHLKTTATEGVVTLAQKWIAELA